MLKKTLHIVLFLISYFQIQAQQQSVTDTLMPFKLKHLSVREQADQLNALSFSMAWQNPMRVAKYAEEARKRAKYLKSAAGRRFLKKKLNLDK